MSRKHLLLPPPLCGEHWEGCTVGVDEVEVSHKEIKETLSNVDYLLVCYKSPTKILP